MGKSEIRNSKFETNPNQWKSLNEEKLISNFNFSLAAPNRVAPNIGFFSFSGLQQFGFVSDFEFRISDF